MKSFRILKKYIDKKEKPPPLQRRGGDKLANGYLVKGDTSERLCPVRTIEVQAFLTEPISRSCTARAGVGTVQATAVTRRIGALQAVMHAHTDCFSRKM